MKRMLIDNIVVMKSLPLDEKTRTNESADHSAEPCRFWPTHDVLHVPRSMHSEHCVRLRYLYISLSMDFQFVFFNSWDM